MMKYSEVDKDRLQAREREIAEKHAKDIHVPKRMFNPEAITLKLKHHLEKQRARVTHGHGLSNRAYRGFLDVEVSKGQLARMMRFVDSFIKLMEKRGHSVYVGDVGSFAVVNNERIPIKFREKCNRIKVRDGVWGNTELVPNGRLSFKLAESYSEIEWSDKKTIALEEQLSTIVAFLELRAENDKLERAERERYWAEQERLQELERIRKAEEAKEQARISELIDHANKWRQARTLRAFISHIESVQVEGGDQEVADWISWAKKVEEAQNPLSQGVKGYVNRFTAQGD